MSNNGCFYCGNKFVITGECGCPGQTKSKEIIHGISEALFRPLAEAIKEGREGMEKERDSLRSQLAAAQAEIQSLKTRLAGKTQYCERCEELAKLKAQIRPVVEIVKSLVEWDNVGDDPLELERIVSMAKTLTTKQIKVEGE